jgi:putative flippase GtrA
MGLKKKFISFCFAGASGAAIELASFNLFFIFLTFIPSKILALAIALSVNFIINRNITFLARSGKITQQFAKYLVIYSIAIMVNLSVSLLMNGILGPGPINANISTVSGIIAAMPITFLGSLHWIFKDKITQK